MKKTPEFDIAVIPHFTVSPSRMIKGELVVTTFYLCDVCKHQIGHLKTSCRCDGFCHPVTEDWDEEKATKLARGRGRPKTTKRKPPPTYNDLSRLG